MCRQRVCWCVFRRGAPQDEVYAKAASNDRLTQTCSQKFIEGMGRVEVETAGRVRESSFSLYL